MKKISSLVIVSLVFVIIFSISVSAVELQDVPQDHWAYNSVNKLIEKGYLTLHEDGTFKGNDKVSRYELAVLIARILEDIQQNDTEVTQEDAESLRKLSLEFREELVDLAKKQDNLFEEVKKVKQNNIVQTKEIGKTKETIDGIEKEISNIINNIMKLRDLEEEVNGLTEKVSSQKTTLEKLQQQLNNKTKMIEEVNKELNTIAGEVGSNKEIKELKDQQSITLTTVHNLKSQVNQLQDKVESQQSEIKNLKKQNDNYKMYIGAVAILSLVMSL